MTAIRVITMVTSTGDQETANRLSEIDMLYIDDTPGIISGSNRQLKAVESSEKRMCWHDSGRT